MPSQPAREKSDSTCWPKKVPLTVAFCGPATIIGHMMPRGIGANGSLAASSSRQAALASGSVPPVGSQRSVHRLGVAPGVAVTTTVSETLAAGAEGLGAELVPVALPQAAAVITHRTAGRRYPAPDRACRKEDFMPM